MDTDLITRLIVDKTGAEMIKNSCFLATKQTNMTLHCYSIHYSLHLFLSLKVPLANVYCNIIAKKIEIQIYL